MATFLDPSTVKYLLNDERHEAERLITAILTNQLPITQTRPATQTKKVIRENVIDSFASSCDLKPNDEYLAKDSVYSLEEEFAFYMTSRKENALDVCTYWRNNHFRLPQLATVVRKYSIIAAASTPSESRFSTANYVARKERSSLSSRNLRFSMILKEKSKFDKIILKKE